MIIEYCATKLIPKIKIDFCPNKRRLILLSCPLQLISTDSRSPSGLRSLPNFKMVIKMCFNSRSPSGLRRSFHAVKARDARFNSRSPSGLRHNAATERYRSLVSIHAAQAGCDLPLHLCQVLMCLFQFTQPKRAATGVNVLANGVTIVSIHAAQAGCDLARLHLRLRVLFQFTQPKRAATVWRLIFLTGVSCFNSRSPSGLRRLLQRYNKKEILSKDKSRKSLLVIIIDVEDKAIELELTDNQPLRNSNKIMFT